MATFDLGRVTPIYKGDYNAATSYELNDVVLYNGNLYWHVRATATVGILPTDTTVWGVVFTDEGVRAEIRGYADNAQASADSASASKSTAAQLASQASVSASQAALSAQTAQTAETGATASAQTASTKASEATASAKAAASSAQTATDKATLASQKAAAASESASIANEAKTAAINNAQLSVTKADEARSSATQAAASATSAQEYDESAQQSAVNAQTSATAAQGYSNVAAQSAESITASATQIAQNTSDIADINGRLDEQGAAIGDVNLFTFSRSASAGAYWNNTVTKAVPSGTKLKVVLKSYEGTHFSRLLCRGYYDETQYDALGTINQIGGSINITTERAYINLRFVFEATATESVGTASVLLLLNDNSGIASEVMLNATNIDTNSQNIQANARSIDELNADMGDLKNALNNEIDLSEYDWVIGSLSPGTGTDDNNSNKRIRSNFIPVATGTKFTVTGNPTCLIVYLFDETGGYLSDSAWNDGNVFVVENDNACYARVLLRKSSANDVLTDADINEQVARCSAYVQLSNGEYLIPRRVSKLETNSGEYIVRSASTSASTGVYWNINDDATPIPAGSIVRFTLNSYSGDNLNTYYFKGRKKTGATITNVILVSSKETGKEFVAQTTEDYIGYQLTVYRSAVESRAVTADYSFAVYDAEGFPVYLMSKLAETNSGKVYNDEVKATVEALQTVLAASATPMLTFAVFTDLHHDPKYPYDPTVDMFANIKAVYDRIHFDGLMNLGDAIDGMNQTQYEAEGCISDVVTAMYDITDRSHNLTGNHDDNFLSTRDNSGGQPLTERLTLLEVNDILFKGSEKEVHNPSHITDYYIDYEEYGIRVICLGLNYTSYVASTQTWLENVALQTDKKVLVYSHCATKAEWGYMNDISNGAYIETPLNNFIANGGTVIAFIHGHTHGDMIETDSSISFTEVAIGCAKFEKMSSGTTGMTYQDRNASDYTKILFDLVCVDQTNRKVHFIRCGAGTDRVISY